MTRVNVCALVAAFASLLHAQDAVATFNQDQLEQMAAPIALYPDALLTQILMASTYPLEITEADRWLDGKAGADDATIDEGLKNVDWDPAVKALVRLPDVVRRMSQNLDWTRDLGDAFLAQQAELMAAIQKLRAEAIKAGNLQTTPEQTVTTDSDGVIVIDQVNPEVVSVPDYGYLAYGDSWTYATSYYPGAWRPGSERRLIFAAGIALGLWGRWDWRHGDVNVDVNRYNNFNQRTVHDFRPEATQAQWRHDIEHRRGIGYRDTVVAQKFQQPGSQQLAASDRARGRAPAGGTPARAPAAPAVQPAHGDERPAAGGDRLERRDDGDHRRADRGALGGATSPRVDRAASQRGAQSRGPAPVRSGGGGRRR